MISKKAVEEQLKHIGFGFKFWGRAEVNELNKILLDDEIIAECVNGEYSNGFALLVATNHRVLLVDKKPMLYLTVEDLRYDMITEFNYSHRMLNATINVYTPNKTLTFMSWNQGRLRRLLEYTQQRVLEMRQQNHMAQQFQAAAAAQYAQLHAANYYQFAPTPSYAPNLAPQQQAGAPAPQQAQPYQAASATMNTVAPPAPQAQPAPATVDSGQPTAQNVEPHTLVSRFAAKRAALGTYTRSKLPSLRRHQANNSATNQAQSGEIYPQGYNPGRPVTDYGLPYEY